MAREDNSERGLPSIEERRQILRQAGMILDEARDLMARLDQHESFHPRSMHEHEQVLERVGQRQCRIRLSTPVPPNHRPVAADQAMAA